MTSVTVVNAQLVSIVRISELLLQLFAQPESTVLKALSGLLTAPSEHTTTKQKEKILVTAKLAQLTTSAHYGVNQPLTQRTTHAIPALCATGVP